MRAFWLAGAAALGLWLAATFPAAAADYQPGAPLETFTGARADFAFRPGSERFIAPRRGYGNLVLSLAEATKRLFRTTRVQ